jgi:ankyrin repeat protein
LVPGRRNSLAAVKQLKELFADAEVGKMSNMKGLIDSTKRFDYTRQWMTTGDIKGRSPLLIASMNGCSTVVELIFEEIIEPTQNEELRKTYINFQDDKGRSSLFYAVAEDHLNIVKVLVENGADMEAITSDKHALPGSTALMACAEKNNVECFDFLIEKGANILVTRNDGADATYIAARYGHQEILERILEMDDARLLVNRSTFHGRTAFITSAFQGHIHICQILLRLVENINHQDDAGITALMYAAREGNVELVKWIFENDGNIDIQDKSGEKALNYAIKYKQIEVVKFLRICKVKWLRKLAAGSQEVDIFKLLVQKARASKIDSNSKKENLPNMRRRNSTKSTNSTNNRRRKSLFPGAKLC